MPKKIVIKKGKHYPFPYFPIFLPKWISRKKATVIERQYMFTESCLYDLVDEDQHDVNKLFGFSIGFHHKTSFRFGWRALLDEKKIQIVAYEYHNGERQATLPIVNIDVDKTYKFILKYFPENGSPSSRYMIFADGNFLVETTIWFSLKKYFGCGYLLGAYFGGNEKAPQDIIIYKI